MDLLTKYFPDLTPNQLGQFSALRTLYEEWNNKINVISRKDMENFYLHHVLHSLAICSKFKLSGNYEVLDIGTGGGFPGIPLAIFFPGSHFHLVDSINKKLKVVDEIGIAIDLTNISTQHCRVEDIHNRKFDVVVTRAVAPLKTLCEWSRTLLKKDVLPGRLHGLIALKGGDLAEEISLSNSYPITWEISKIFDEHFFKEKYLLYIQSTQPCFTS